MSHVGGSVPACREMDLSRVPTPCFVIDMQALEHNLQVLSQVESRSGACILLALKAFATFSTFPLVKRYLKGVCASGLHEAQLGREMLNGEVHVYSPAYSDDDFLEILKYADHVSFNSFHQWRRFRPMVERLAPGLKCGLRINPQHSEVEVALYDPCAPRSRLGITLEHFEPEALGGITGLHFHTLCELNANALQRTLEVVEARFGRFIEKMEWMNFGGGHHITRADYDIDLLCSLVDGFRARYPNLQRVYLEPGEAIGLNAGVLVASVLDILDNDGLIAVLDTSATAHMPDVLEMPYRPTIVGAGEPGEFPYTYRLGGQTCLAGDVVGDYSFREPLEIGSKLVFLDMAHYTMVKTTTFNGVRLPSIALYHPETGDVEVVRSFGYEDYKMRLS